MAYNTPYYTRKEFMMIVGLKNNSFICKKANEGKYYEFFIISTGNEHLFEKQMIFHFIQKISNYIGLNPEDVIPLKYTLLKYCYNQNQVAQLLGIPRGTLSRWIKNKKIDLPPSIRFLNSRYYLKTKIHVFMDEIYSNHINILNYLEN